MYLDGFCREELSQVLQIIAQNINICYNTTMVTHVLKNINHEH